MNLLNTAICETDNGDLLIVWGGRRIVTQAMYPAIVDGGSQPGVETIYRRRYRWDNGNMVITRIYDNLTKRIDYVGPFGRNPAIVQDMTGRIFIGYRIPVVSSQDPQGALSSEYVVARNIGTTAGMNFWDVLRADDLSLLAGAYPFDWQEQVEIPVAFLELGDMPTDFESLAELFAGRGEIEGLSGPGETTMVMFTDWTFDKITGRLVLRGMGANEMDMELPARWRWNADGGLGRDYTSCYIDAHGRQIRLSGNQVMASYSDRWEAGQKVVMTTLENYGLSGALRSDRFGRYLVAGHNAALGEIPWQTEDEYGLHTLEACDQQDAQSLYAADNRREWVLENANVPAEGYFSWEEPPTPQQQAALSETLRQYYYALPTLASQRPGITVTADGLIVLAWMHGNLTIVPDSANGGHDAVGMRMAVSRNNGRTFEPLIPTRTGKLQGVFTGDN